MKPEKKITPSPGQEKEPIELLSVPGLSIHLPQAGDVLYLEAEGALKAVCTPILKKINSRLKEEKPALVETDRVIPSAWLPPIPGPVFRRLLFAEMQIALGRSVPETVSIEVTHQNRARIPKVQEELSLEKLKKVIDEALDLGALIINITENDPLLRDGILELIEYVDKNRAIVNCSTWGTDFTEETALSLKQAGLHSLMVGIYSTDPTKHDSARNARGAYEKAISAIKTGLSAGLLVVMTTHVSPSNIEELPALYALAEELGVQEFSVWEAMPKTGGEAAITDEDRKTILEMYHRINSKPEGPRMFANTYFEGQMLGSMEGRRWMHVCADGAVKPSPYVPFFFGNIKKEPLKNSWQKIRSCPYFQRQKPLSPMHDPEFLELVARIPEGADLP